MQRNKTYAISTFVDFTDGCEYVFAIRPTQFLSSHSTRHAFAGLAEAGSCALKLLRVRGIFCLDILTGKVDG